MSDLSQAKRDRAANPAAVPRRPPLWQKILMRWLSGLVTGELTVVFPGGRTEVVRGPQPGGPTATIVFHRGRVVWRMMTAGDMGFAESYLDGDWTSPDLGALLDFGYANEAVLKGPLTASPLLAMAYRVGHRLRANTRRGSRRNIAAHYDLGNDFYRLWLDETMTYSSALFTAPEMSLADAQREKYRRIIELLEIKPTDTVLEIGCGWGGFAEIAASETGCSVTCLTLSQEQAAFARQRMADAGLAERVEIRLEDYRDVQGTYDKIVSIEMFEAVGEKNWPAYFAVIQSRLKSLGRAALQVITISDERMPSYRKSVDFIQRYIFPGGMLPSAKALAKEIETAGLKLKDTVFFGRSYAETLQRWDERFQAKWDEIAKLGFDDRFARMWRYYLQGCRASFRATTSNVGQFLIQKR